MARSSPLGFDNQVRSVKRQLFSLALITNELSMSPVYLLQGYLDDQLRRRS